MGQIVVLDPHMINKIAAGEVIERPASVVKELTENSIDAGAASVVVAIEDGGRRLISVSDDGIGMDGDDLGRAFTSHATSKVRTDADLEAIATLGFRGEALASVAAVAQVRAVTRTRESDQAHCLEIDCGRAGPVTPCSGDCGTTIEVRDLFYKLPARRKFLRTANTEMGHITEQFTRVALARRDLDLRLVHNGRELLRLGRGDGLRDRVAALFGMIPAQSRRDLVEVETNEKGIRISALLGRPEISRTTGKFQYVFLNGRFVRDKFISHAIREAYRGMLDHSRHPVVFLFIEMDPADYDVNVHPTKIEVRFYNANLVHSQVLGALRERLLAADVGADAQLPAAGAFSDEPASSGATEHRQNVADAMAEFFRKHRPQHTQSRFDLGRHSTAVRRLPAHSQWDRPTTMDRVGTEGFIQIHDSFIIQETDDGFVIVDQHALHERILYQSLRERIRNSALQSQKLLVPESFEVTGVQAAAIEARTELLARLGIDLAEFGPRAYAVQAFPTLLERVGAAEFVQDILDLLVDKADELSAEDLLDAVLQMAACKGAIKAGQRLSLDEIRHLLQQGQRVESAGHCPHGRPTTIRFSVRELEKQFKRT